MQRQSFDALTHGENPVTQSGARARFIPERLSPESPDHWSPLISPVGALLDVVTRRARRVVIARLATLIALCTLEWTAPLHEN